MLFKSTDNTLSTTERHTFADKRSLLFDGASCARRFPQKI